ncbi:unnamed protein product [Protopolystoma xenopodis]|uniref:Uncharacterized protein n=1 Tax=Protopolystoma xenopodis TaxID=117903 RepID=A0A448XN39_9PLAT|nr:unnamed protein product [Protopolystoma xenopodis]
MRNASEPAYSHFKPLFEDGDAKPNLQSVLDKKILEINHSTFFTIHPTLLSCSLQSSLTSNGSLLLCTELENRLGCLQNSGQCSSNSAAECGPAARIVTQSPKDTRSAGRSKRECPDTGAGGTRAEDGQLIAFSTSKLN